MTKKKKWLMGLAAFVLTLIVLLCFYLGARTFYINTDNYREHWGVELPSKMKLEYSIDNTGFPGDGTVYTIRKVLQSADGLFEDYSFTKDAIMEEIVNDLLNALKVPDDKLPNWELDYQWKSFYNQAFDDLYVIYIPSSQTLIMVKSLS